MLVSTFHCEIGASVICLDAQREEARVEGRMKGEGRWTKSLSVRNLGTENTCVLVLMWEHWKAI